MQFSMEDLKKEVVCKGISPMLAFYEGLENRRTDETDCFRIMTDAILASDEIMIVMDMLYNLEGLKLCLIGSMIKGMKDPHCLGVSITFSLHPSYLLLPYPILLQVCLDLFKCF